MENTGGYFSVPRVSIVNKQVIFKSPVYLTPLKTPVLIDGTAVRELVAGAYREAGCTPADVNTGTVIITGESARKENAAEVLRQLSDFAGEFVVSTAGPDLESIIAGKGSGAYQYSMDNGCTAVNLDIGGRLIRLEKDLTVTYISPAAQAVADAVGVEIAVGRRTSCDALERITDKMADLLAQALFAQPQEELLARIHTPESSWFDVREPIRAICFSGGVADCIAHQPDEIPYGDIGALLGRSIARGMLMKRFPCISSTETIRATVVGAGTYTTTISGSTIDYAPGLLPMKNIPALILNAREQAACFADVSGNPALGVGPGNGPSYIEKSANIPLAVKRIFDSKTFDNGTICASGQSIVTEHCIKDQVIAEVKKQGGYFLSPEETAKAGRFIMRANGTMNPKIVGKSAQVIADMAGITKEGK